MIRIQARLKARATVIRSSELRVMSRPCSAQTLTNNHAPRGTDDPCHGHWRDADKVHRSNSSAISATQDDLLLSQWRGIGLVVQAPFSDIPARPTHPGPDR